VQIQFQREENVLHHLLLIETDLIGHCIFKNMLEKKSLMQHEQTLMSHSTERVTFLSTQDLICIKLHENYL